MTGHQKRQWVTPKAIRYGSVKEITQQIKNKTWGGGDDVVIDSQQLLTNAGS